MGGVHQTYDARSNSLEAAIEFAQTTGLQGIVSDATPLVKSPSWVQTVKSAVGAGAKQGLKLMSYGGANIVPGNAKLLQEAGIDGVIVDRVKQVGIELGLLKK
jgi:glycerophosphodiester phosphodiesterase